GASPGGSAGGTDRPASRTSSVAIDVRGPRGGHDRLAVLADPAGETASTAPISGSSGDVTSRTSKIGVRVPCRTDSATEPKIRRPIPPRPWLVMMMRSAFSTDAASTIVDAAGPYQTAVCPRGKPPSPSPATTPFSKLSASQTAPYVSNEGSPPYR